MKKFDFSGWATKFNIRCSDGRTIIPGAFKDQDGATVPLVYNHGHRSPDDVIGHAVLEHRDEGVYAYCSFNETEKGKISKLLVEHGDIHSLSIYANRLKQQGSNVIHGAIRELSLVLAGANPGAVIDTIIQHSDNADEEAIIHYDDEGENTLVIPEDEEEVVEEVTEEETPEENPVEEKPDEEETPEEAPVEETETPEEEPATEETEEVAHADEEPDSEEDLDDETVGEILETLNEKQEQAVSYLIGSIIAEKEKAESNKDNKESQGGNETMKHNVFDKTDTKEKDVLCHADQEAILNLAKSKSVGSLQEAIEIYAADESTSLQHGIDDIEQLFPEYKDVYPGAPGFIERDQTWVDKVIGGTKKSPISRIRTRQADITGTDLRALGYEKGTKKEKVGNIKLLSRTTDPQTVYRTDALERDDIIDITDFDVVAYQYYVMKQNLKEEIAQAIMIGDQREDGDKHKIKEEHIRSIWHDDELYTIHYDVDIEAAREELQGTDTNKHFGENYIYAEAIVTAALYSREKYKGSGSLDFFCTPHLLNVMLLARDLNGRRIYDSKADLAAALNVNNIYTIEQFEGKTRTTKEGDVKKLLGIFVNLKDYQVGSTKGGEITNFKQFDIDYNQEKYLIETRMSGALTRVKSAIVLEEPEAAESGASEE